MVNQTRIRTGGVLRFVAWGLLLGGLVVVAVPLLQPEAPEASWAAAGAWRTWSRLGVAVVLALLGWWALRTSRRWRRSDPTTFLTPGEAQRVEAAIEALELRTSAELRVHLSGRSGPDPERQAVSMFEKLGMHATAERNGVLFHVDVPGHGIVILGDKGIDAKVPEDFWDAVLERVLDHFARAEFAEGLVAGIEAAGEALQEHFPRSDDDVDELPNELSRD